MGSPPGRARRDVVLRDHIAVNEDMSNDPRYNRTEAKTVTRRSGSTIVKSDKSGQATQATGIHNIRWHHNSSGDSLTLGGTRCKKRQTKKNPVLLGRREREETRQRTRTRSGRSGETNHKLHPPQVSGRGTPGSGKEKANGASLSTCLSCDVQGLEKLAS